VLSPQEELQTFRFPSGFRIELLAAEPLVHVALGAKPSSSGVEPYTENELEALRTGLESQRSASIGVPPW
jgi:hypothetical protein